MSAFIVSKDHIDTILSAYAKVLKARHDTPPDLDHLGKTLWRENARSVAYRYEEAEDKQWETYKFKNQPNSILTPVEVYALVDCLEYQSCEHPGWEVSEAAKLCRRIKDTLIASLPEWKDAAWSL
jgi:hypothetical protein